MSKFKVGDRVKSKVILNEIHFVVTNIHPISEFCEKQHYIICNKESAFLVSENDLELASLPSIPMFEIEKLQTEYEGMQQGETRYDYKVWAEQIAGKLYYIIDKYKDK